MDTSYGVRDAFQACGDELGLPISAVVLTPVEPAAMKNDDLRWAAVVREARSSTSEAMLQRRAV